MKMKLVQRPMTAQIMDRDTHDFTGWDWKNLGLICKGVQNDEGYCNVYAHLGRPDKDSDFIIIRIREKYFYTLSGNPHHIDEVTWDWCGDLDFYINEYKGEDKRTWDGAFNGSHTGGFRKI